MKYICLHCGHHFDGDEIVAKHYDRATGTWDSEECPNCGSEYFEEAEKCDKCGEWHVADKVVNGMCEECLTKAATPQNAYEWGEQEKQGVELNGFIAWAFTADEIESILLNELMKDKDLAAKYARDYCMDDSWMFAEYLKGEEDK